MQRSHIQSDFSRLSLNQVTTRRWSLREAVEGCLQAGVPAIALWRDKVAEVGLAEAARIVRESGLRVSSLHVGGDFPAASEANWAPSSCLCGPGRRPIVTSIRRVPW